MTMKTSSYSLVFITLIASFINLSYQYGMKGSQGVSHSFSSSSASSHASSFSSSSSFGYGGVKAVGIVPIIGPIPVAAATASASASAGASVAVSHAQAGAAAGSYNQNTLIQGDGGSNDAANQVHDGSYSAGNNYAGTGSKSQVGGGYYGGQTAGSTGTVSGGSYNQNGQSSGYQNQGTVGGSYNDNGGSTGYQNQDKISTGIVAGGAGYGGSYSKTDISGGASYVLKGNTQNPGTYQHDKSFEKKYFQPVDEDTPVEPQAGGGYQKIDEQENTLIGNKHFPGPNGSIYDYKVPSQVNTITGNQGSSYVHTGVATGSYGGSISGSYGGGSSSVTGEAGKHKKPCCNGPFPGPSGSIYDSKPALEVGTAIKLPASYQPVLQPNKPIGGSVSYGYQGSSGFSASNTGTYQTQHATPAGPSPSCTQGTCTNTQTTQQQSHTIKLDQTPVTPGKPVTETIPVVPKTQNEKDVAPVYIAPNPRPNSVPDSPGSVIVDYTPVIPQKPQVQPSNTLPNLPQGTPGTVVPSIVEPQTKEQPIIPVQIPVGNVPVVGQTSTTGSTYSQGSVSGYSGNTSPTYKPGTNQNGANSFVEPSVSHSKPSIIVENQKKDGEDKTVYISNPIGAGSPTYSGTGSTGYSGAGSTAYSAAGSTAYSTSFVGGSSSSGHISSATKNIVISGGLQEGTRGSPFEHSPKTHPQTSYGDKNIGSGSSSVKPVEIKPETENSYYKPVGKIPVEEQPITFPDKTISQVSGGGFVSSSSSSSGTGAYDGSLNIGYSSSGVKGYTSDSKQIYGVEINDHPSETLKVAGQKPSGGNVHYQSGNTDVVKTEIKPEGPKVIQEQPVGVKPSGITTSTIHFDITKLSDSDKDGSIYYSKPEVKKIVDGSNVLYIASDSHGLGSNGQSSFVSVSGGNTHGSYGGSSSRGFSSSSSSGHVGHKGIPCNKHGCGTPFRQYSNAVPSTEHKNKVSIYISTVPLPVGDSYGGTHKHHTSGGSHKIHIKDETIGSSIGSHNGDSYSGSHVGYVGHSGGSHGGYGGHGQVSHSSPHGGYGGHGEASHGGYGGHIEASHSGSHGGYGGHAVGTHSGSYGDHGGSSHSGSYGGHGGASYGGSSEGGLASGASGYGGQFSKGSSSSGDAAGQMGGFLSSIFSNGPSGSYAKSGGHAEAGSYSKAHSFASSSSYASASSGAYSSGHY